MTKVVDEYIKLIRRFIDHKITANEFDKQVWKINLIEEPALMLEDHYNAYSDLLYYADIFCDIPEIFDPKTNIDEHELRRQAENVYNRFLEANERIPAETRERIELLLYIIYKRERELDGIAFMLNRIVLIGHILRPLVYRHYAKLSELAEKIGSVELSHKELKSLRGIVYQELKEYNEHDDYRAKLESLFGWLEEVQETKK